jgi:transposase
MLADNLRDTVRTLYKNGKGKKGIARYLEIDVKTVRAILKSESNKPREREDKIKVDETILRELYERCNGFVERMYEILVEEHHLEIGYSTLTRLVREYGLLSPQTKRNYHLADIPGEEIQHDTSTYQVLLGGKRTKVIASVLYFRYSKMRYVRFYPRFTQFIIKCFFHEALVFFGYTAMICVIDNTHLVVHHGTGENAVFYPEMVAFAKRYGFQWKAHRIKHPDRKAGEERSFYTLETNFLPGRTFKNLDDLNEQVFRWATERFAHRPLSRSRLIPARLFESERSYLNKLPDYIQPPYKEHQPKVDKAGYISFNGNYFWVPEKDSTGRNVSDYVKVVEYDKRIDIYHNHEKLISYNLPAWDVKNQEFYPGEKRPTPLQPCNRKKGCDVEEQKLKEMGTVSCQYLDFIKSPDCRIRQKPKLIRDIYRLSKKMEPSLFTECLSRALKYKIDTVESITRIAGQLLYYPPQKPETETESHVPPDDYEQRPSYKQGEFSTEVDLQLYSDLLEEKSENG